MADRRRGDRRKQPTLPDEVQAALAAAFTPEQRNALESVWAINAGTLNSFKTILVGLVRTVRGGLALLLALMLATAVVSAILFAGQSSETKHAAKQLRTSIQTSRFDGAYRSCEGANDRHMKARAKIAATLAPFPAGVRDIAGPIAAILNDSESPLRLAGHGTLAQQMQRACVLYAVQQTALNVPALSAPRPPK